MVEMKRQKNNLIKKVLQIPMTIYFEEKINHLNQSIKQFFFYGIHFLVIAFLFMIMSK